MTDSAAALFVLLSVAAVAAGVWWLWRWSGEPSEQWTCTRCEMTAGPEYYKAGSTLLLIILLFLGILPGLIYWLWTRSNSHWGCAYCGSQDLVPEGSPRAKRISSQL